MVKEAVCQRATDPLVKEDEDQRDLHAFVGQPIGITSAVAFNEAVTFQLPQVVAKLIQPVAFGWNAVRGKNGGMDLRRPPTGDGGAIV